MHLRNSFDYILKSTGTSKVIENLIQQSLIFDHPRRIITDGEMAPKKTLMIIMKIKELKM